MQPFGSKITQQFKALVNRLADIRFKWNDGTQRTFCNVISLLKLTLPVAVMGAVEPVGKLTSGIVGSVVCVRKFGSEEM